MRKITIWDRLRYGFDNTMAKGVIALIGWLFVASLVMIGVFSVFIVLARVLPIDPGGDGYAFREIFWMTTMRALDAGAVADDEGPWFFRLTMFGIAVGGLFLVSILIGVITSGIEAKIEDLRKGRSLVIEKGHTVILGWTPQVFSIISELVIANENQKGSCIAILAENDKVEMEDEIREKVGNTRGTRIVCRTGNPIDLTDLEIANPHAARSIIIPSPEIEDPDAHVIKSILAITNNPNRRPEPYHIVAEIRTPKNMEVARLVGGDEAQLVLADDLIARITVQASLQSGLSVVYTELLDFGGDEIYFHQEPQLVGKTFGEALMAYEDSAPIGLRFADGWVQLNPPMETRIAEGDKVIAVSEDDDTVRLSGLANPEIDENIIYGPDHVTIIPTRVLLMGWNRRIISIIDELDSYVNPGSGVTIITDAPDAEEKIRRDCDPLKNSTLEFVLGDITDRTTLDALNVASYRNIIILSHSDTLSPQQADARTLITLLHLRDIANRSGAGFSITSEMLEVQNRDLAAITRADDFIVSNKLVSLMLSQISENKELTAVFEDLFDVEGSELYLKPIEDYVKLGEPMNFYTLVEAARRRNEVALGYRIKVESNDVGKTYGVYVNPRKSERVKFGEDDRLIVLAED